jgi:hypothetical protein
VLVGAVVVLAGGSILLRSDPRPAEPAAAPAAAPLVVTPKDKVTVEVLNGTQRQGAARTATRMLRRKGLDVVFLGNADSLADSTRIIARRGDVERARYVAAALGSGVVVVETDTFRRVDVSVILGDDFQPASDLHP